jgi:hypothetical protein
MSVNMRNSRIMTRAYGSNNIKVSSNPFVLGKMKHNDKISSREQYVRALVKSHIISEDDGARYLKLKSNNNTTLSNNAKKNLKPWLLPKPPPGFKPKPPPRRTMKNINKRPSTPTTYNSSNNNVPRARSNASVRSNASEPRDL